MEQALKNSLGVAGAACKKRSLA